MTIFYIAGALLFPALWLLWRCLRWVVGKIKLNVGVGSRPPSPSVDHLAHMGGAKHLRVTKSDSYRVGRWSFFKRSTTRTYDIGSPTGQKGPGSPHVSQGSWPKLPAFN